MGEGREPAPLRVSSFLEGALARAQRVVGVHDGRIEEDGQERVCGGVCVGRRADVAEPRLRLQLGRRDAQAARHAAACGLA
ncbi:MAG: hypothetical protein AAFV53_04885 [Myxococcota bacterium]